MSIYSKWHSEDFQNDLDFEESREKRADKKEAEKMKQVDRTIEMFNDINALFGYTRN